MADAYEIAAWRFEQIAPLLDPSLCAVQRRAAMRERTTRAVTWPQSDAQERLGKRPKNKPIPRSTLFRWMRAFEKDGYVGLIPASRAPRPDSPSQSAAANTWATYAIGLLYEQPNRSLTQLQAYLLLEYPTLRMSRSKLSRHLRAHPAYEGILGLRRGKRRRTFDLYESDHPHQSWQLDGKGPFTVRLVSGERVAVHVLSILDDYSRAILATVVSLAEDIDAAIRVFQKAAGRYGLPDRFQFDRGSAFDSHVFRHGLARCGVHRNLVRARHPEAQGKIEAYHRTLKRWLVEELRAQEVFDLEHLAQLTEAMIALLYNPHYHREIKSSPDARLGGKVSDRRLSTDDLARAFFVSISAKSHAKTGEVLLDGRRFKVPAALAGKRCQFLYDLVQPDVAYLVTKDRREIALRPFRRRPLPKPRGGCDGRAATGQLQKLLDVWQGKERPNAQPGFGLPDVFLELEKLAQRPVPKSEAEARTILDFYRRCGPLPKEPFRRALQRCLSALGEGRPIQTYLKDIERQIDAAAQRKDDDPQAPTETME